MKKSVKAVIARLFLVLAIMLISVQLVPTVTVYGYGERCTATEYAAPFCDKPVRPISEAGK